MVWHALLLNPSWFRSFEGRPLKNFYNVPFPWKEIVSDVLKPFREKKSESPS